MNPTIPKVATHPRDKNIHLLPPPPQAPRQQRQTKSLQPIQNIHLVPAPQLLHERVLRPAVGRPHEDAGLDVDEAGLGHPGAVEVGTVGAHGAAELARRFAEELAPAQEVGVVGCAVGGFDGEAVVLQFEPATGFEVSGGGRVLGRRE